MFRQAILISCLFLLQNCAVWNCTKEEAGKAFKTKILVGEYPSLSQNPYDNCDQDCEKNMQNYLKDKEIVCGYQYLEPSKRYYQLRTFTNKQQANSQNFSITHQGRCGECSSFQDLSVYLSKDLTDPIAKCGIYGIINIEWQRDCIMKVGFTKECSQIWGYNTINTRKQCFWTCIWWKEILRHGPNMPDGSLNPCIQCDEDLSGPIFKYYSGRTRRNSGIKSEIDRPGDQVYDIDQCYF